MNQGGTRTVTEKTLLYQNQFKDMNQKEEPEREHPQKKIERLLMEKQDQDDGVVFNGKPCHNGCNCAEVEEYHHGKEALKRGFQCLSKDWGPVESTYKSEVVAPSEQVKQEPVIHEIIVSPFKSFQFVSGDPLNKDGLREMIKADINDAIEKQEQEQREEYHKGREDAMKYCLELLKVLE